MPKDKDLNPNHIVPDEHTEEFLPAAKSPCPVRGYGSAQVHRLYTIINVHFPDAQNMQLGGHDESQVTIVGLYCLECYQVFHIPELILRMRP